MNHLKSFILLAATLGLLSACASGWTTSNHYDEFTDMKVCRIERGTKFERDFAKGFTESILRSTFTLKIIMSKFALVCGQSRPFLSAGMCKLK